MTNFWSDYGMFALKSVTIIALIILFFVLLLGLLAGAREEAKKERKARLKATILNDQYHQYEQHITRSSLSGKALKQYDKAQKREEKNKDNNDRPRLFVINFNGDIAANQVSELRELISSLILAAKESDEVIVRLESGGGTVPGYGLAAAQLARLRAHNIPLTIAIDKVAASGGYMMASVGDKIIASPFSIIGSIGVVATMPNFNKWLQEKNIEYEQVTAGEYKRTLTMFGKNTDEAREKLHQELEQVLVHFKSHIQTYRPQVNVDAVATGEYWHALDAQSKNLVDHLQTSDEYILSKLETHQIVGLKLKTPQSFFEKLMNQTMQIKSRLTASIKEHW